MTRVPWTILSSWMRVVLLRILVMWLGAVIVFQCIDVFENLRDYTSAGATTSMLIAWFLMRTPEIAFQILPAAVLLGALLALFHIAKHREMTAAEASGLHPVWIYAVPLSIGFALSLGQILLEVNVLPELRSSADKFYATKIEQNPLRIEDPVRWTVVGSDLWRLERAPAGQLNLERYRKTSNGFVATTIKDVVASNNAWTYGEARSLHYPGALEPVPVAALQIPFLPEELKPVRSKSRHLPLLTLLERAREKLALTGSVSPMLLEFHQRISWALMCFTVLVAVLPLVPRHGRRASAASGVLMALVVGLAGWAVIVFGTALATTDKNVWGFWLPHLFLLLTGILGSTRISNVVATRLQLRAT